MYFVRRNPDLRSINAVIRCYSYIRKSHYDVLNLRKNCSDKDIKEAFIQMSKEFHPDINKDVKAQDKFVRIVEAYNVLSKPGSRARYDNTIEVESYPQGSPYNSYRPHVPYNLRNNPKYSYYYEYSKTGSTTHQNENAYYGMAGLKRVPNYAIIMICFGVACIGVLLQVFVIRNLYVSQRQRAQEQSKLLAEELERVRASARDNGNELQTRMLLDKIVSAANPTVATASLGQALANEKK